MKRTLSIICVMILSLGIVSAVNVLNEDNSLNSAQNRQEIHYREELTMELDPLVDSISCSNNRWISIEESNEDLTLTYDGFRYSGINNNKRIYCRVENNGNTETFYIYLRLLFEELDVEPVEEPGNGNQEGESCFQADLCLADFARNDIRDGRVDLSDYADFANHFGEKGITPGSMYDLYPDGEIDLIDYEIFRKAFGKSGCPVPHIP